MRTLKRQVSTADDMAAEIKDSSVLVQSMVTLVTEQAADVTRHHRNVTASTVVLQSALVDAEKFNSLQKSMSLLPPAFPDNTALENVQLSLDNLLSTFNGIEARVALLEQPSSAITQ